MQLLSFSDLLFSSNDSEILSKTKDDNKLATEGVNSLVRQDSTVLSISIQPMIDLWPQEEPKSTKERLTPPRKLKSNHTTLVPHLFHQHILDLFA
jgi:hypothetical protein